ncbi:MAG TPA: hypothetical protein VKT28_19030 [Puia sp.]|nr:hypothetical protein [Puia sp.]
MKNFLLITTCFLFIGLSGLNAQLNVGSTSAPDASSILQLTSSNKGLRLSNVSLTSTTSFGLAGSASAATIGMQVYNTNAGIAGSTSYPASSGGAGIYVWDGTGWRGSASFGSLPLMAIHASGITVTRSGAGGFTNFITANAGVNGTLDVNTIPSATFTGSSGNISLPAGTYLITLAYSVSCTTSETSPVTHAFFYDFPADLGGFNGTYSRIEETQTTSGGTSNNNISIHFSYLSILTGTRSLNFGIGWGSGVNNMPSTPTYGMNASFSIIKLQ